MKILSFLAFLLVFSGFNDMMGQWTTGYEGFKAQEDANGMDMAMMEPDSTAKTIYIKSDGNVGIGTATPNSSALVDIPSASKGVLLPRMTLEQRNAIAGPAEGLMVYCTNCSANGALCVFTGGEWMTFSPCNTPSPSPGINTVLQGQVIWNWTVVAGAVGYKWNTTDSYLTATDMGAAITKSESGTTCNTTYTSYVWTYSTCGISAPTVLTETTDGPEAPESGTHIADQWSVEWNWSSVPRATGYKWNTTNDYGTATDLGTAIMKSETDLTCDETYMRYVWAYNGCGNSNPVTLTQTTLPCPCDSAYAGPDQLNLVTLTTALQGNTPYGSGLWSILSGTGGNITDPSDPASNFTGIESHSYTLKWEITSQCPTVSDTLLISIACPTANAGPDQVNVPDTTTILEGNTPFAGMGSWIIFNGVGGNIADPSDPNSVFTGVPGGVNYILRWAVTSNCSTAYDYVNISFECNPQPDTAEAGPDQISVPGVTTTLAGNTPVIGTGTWVVASGDYGIIADPSNPASLFTGTEGTSYMLQWSINNWCGTSTDYVTISFDNFSCGNSFRDMRDDTVNNTTLIGEQCWMAENLSFWTSSSSCAGYDCYGFGRLYDWNTASIACPTGWHLPSDAEFCTLAHSLDPNAICVEGQVSWVAGGMIKETGTTYWYWNEDATNSSGFSARGAGTAEGCLYEKAIFWTSSDAYSGKRTWEVDYNGSALMRNSYYPSGTVSVRCVKD